MSYRALVKRGGVRGYMGSALALAQASRPVAAEVAAESPVARLGSSRLGKTHGAEIA